MSNTFFAHHVAPNKKKHPHVSANQPTKKQKTITSASLDVCVDALRLGRLDGHKGEVCVQVSLMSTLVKSQGE